MNTQQERLLNFVLKLKLSVLMFEELENQDSKLVKFINSFTLNYITSRLNQSERQNFADLLEHEVDDGKVWKFVRKHINNFDESYESELEKRLRNIKDTVVR